MVFRSGSEPEAPDYNNNSSSNNSSVLDGAMASGSSPQSLNSFAAPGGVKSTKILLRLSVKSKVVCEVVRGGGEAAEPLAVAVNEDQNQTDGGVGVGVVVGDSGSEEAAPKTWNFRPRKPLVKKKQPGAAASVNKGGRGGPEVKRSQVQSQAKGSNGKKKKKEKEKESVPKLCVSLSKQEIEEDIFVMTGSKPSRRPKKRAKHVQKQLDSLFPGLWLYSISADAYKVPDPPLKI